MKKKSFYICLMGIAMIGLTSCAGSFLDREPYGGTIRQDQYEQLSNTLPGTMRGIYAMLGKYSSHDAFGERSIDMYGDILCGDMALTAYNYGYFYCDENRETNTDRTDYLWGHYYSMLHNINGVIKLVTSQPDTIQPTAQMATIADNYAQALTLRAYVLQQLLFYYCPTTPEILHGSKTYTWQTYPTFPIYTETTPYDANPGYAHLQDTYEMIERDLKTAIATFSAYRSFIARPDKQTVDIDVARAILAYSYLNKADWQAAPASNDYKNPYTEALHYAEELLASSTATILPKARVLTSGFNDVNEASWIWGQEVTTETATGLGSFFGQVDIHTYSYAWAGDTKVIDKNLFEAIPTWDIRRNWWISTSGNKFYLCPSRKFFSAACPESTDADDIDREWLSDNVLMRIESIYLMAAEAACRLGQYDKARLYLFAITDERVKDGEEAAYSAWKSGLTDAQLLDAITLNWRVEMWGEGYGLQTFRRLTHEVTRGSNHLRGAGQTESYDNGNYLIIIPSNEFLYNPSL